MGVDRFIVQKRLIESLLESKSLEVIASRQLARNPNFIGGCTVTGLDGAISNGHLKIVRSIYGSEPELQCWPKDEDGPEVMRSLLDRDDREMLAFFRTEREMRLHPKDFEKVAFRGDLTRVKLICELDLVGLTSMVLDITAVRGDSAMHRVFTSCDVISGYSSRAMDGAAEEGHFSMIQHLHASRGVCSRRAIDLAARNGYLNVVQFLKENRREDCSKWAIYWASACGHGSVVEYLVSENAPCDIDKCQVVTRSQGHAEILVILESYRPVCQRSSRSLARRRKEYQLQVNTTPSRVVYCEIGRELWPKGLPSNL